MNKWQQFRKWLGKHFKSKNTEDVKEPKATKEPKTPPVKKDNEVEKLLDKALKGEFDSDSTVEFVEPKKEPKNVNEGTGKSPKLKLGVSKKMPTKLKELDPKNKTHQKEMAKTKGKFLHAVSRAHGSAALQEHKPDAIEHSKDVHDAYSTIAGTKFIQANPEALELMHASSKHEDEITQRVLEYLATDKEDQELEKVLEKVLNASNEQTTKRALDAVKELLPKGDGTDKDSDKLSEQNEGEGESNEDEALSKLGKDLIEELTALPEAPMKSPRELSQMLDDSIDYDHSYSQGSNIIYAGRDPNRQEQKLRKELTQKLQLARFRARDVSIKDNQLPPGRLRVRQAMENQAAISRGKMPEANQWRKKRHRYVESPKMRLAVLVDVSGSMQSVVQDVSSSLWILAQAIHNTGGKTNAWAFGDNVEHVLPPGRPIDKVLEFNADGGTEYVAEALEGATKKLDLFNAKDGPRMVVIVSDGEWVDTSQDQKANELIQKLRKSGVELIITNFGHISPHIGLRPVNLNDRDELVSVLGETMVNLLSENGNTSNLPEVTTAENYGNYSRYGRYHSYPYF